MPPRGSTPILWRYFCQLSTVRHVRLGSRHGFRPVIHILAESITGRFREIQSSESDILQPWKRVLWAMSAGRQVASAIS